jgi:hypothetical protein
VQSSSEARRDNRIIRAPSDQRSRNQCKKFEFEKALDYALLKPEKES